MSYAVQIVKLSRGPTCDFGAYTVDKIDLTIIVVHLSSHFFHLEAELLHKHTQLVCPLLASLQLTSELALRGE